MISPKDTEKVERLILLSEQNPLLPDTYIPWKTQENGEPFMPDELLSLHGHPLFEDLTPEQKRELGRREMAQVMYAYGWSEGLACLIFNKRLIKLSPSSIEYRYLVKELIEEFRHQDMFARGVQLLNVENVKASRLHKFIGMLHFRLFPVSFQFISVISIEMVTDIYGKIVRKDERIFLPIRKISELHHIEEGRHIYYTKLWLDEYTRHAGFIKRTFFSILALSNILFMRTMYVRWKNFEAIGVKNPKVYAKAARQNLKLKFGALCLQDAISFVDEFNGFNFITKPLWRFFIKAKV